MGWLSDLLQGIPTNSVLRERVALAEQKYKDMEEQNRQFKEQNEVLAAEVQQLKTHISSATSAAPEERHLDDNDVLCLLQSWMEGRTEKANTAAIFWADVDRDLRLPEGSAQRLLEQAARKAHYHLEHQGSSTIKFVKILPASHAPIVCSPSIRDLAPRAFARR